MVQFGFSVPVPAFFLLTAALAQAAPLPDGVYEKALSRAKLKAATQSYCYETASGEVLGERVDAPVIPASVTKAYTTYVALKKLGPDFRFLTRVSIETGARGAILHFAGDHDGYFVSEHVFYLMNLLARQGVTGIERVTFDSKFYLNFELEPARVRAQLLNLMNPARWDDGMRASYDDFHSRAKTFGLESQESAPGIQTASVAFSDENPLRPGKEQVIELRSLPLLDLLKDMNVHSTNRFAKAVFVRLNDREEFNRVLREDLNASGTELEFFDGSGGKANHTTCRITLRLFRALEILLNGYSRKLDSAISVAGMDGGTLRRRFLEPEASGSVIGKTGTLPDVFVSTLAGLLSAQSGPLFYGIFNRYQGSTLSAAHGFQEEIVREILKAHDGKREIEHSPWDFEVLRGLIPN